MYNVIAKMKIVPKQYQANALRVVGSLGQAEKELKKDNPAIDFFISSIYRDPVTNAKVGGSKNSDHLRANAIDFTAVDKDKKENVCEVVWFWLRENAKFDQCILERKTAKDGRTYIWIHYSDRGEANRNMAFTIGFDEQFNKMGG